MENRDLTLSQAAQSIGVSVVTLRKLIHAGKLDAYSLDPDAQRPAYRVTASALQAFRDKGRVVPSFTNGTALKG
jgi:excisionase family DNA binding protein